MIIQLAICISWYFISGTVDGRNPAPVDMVNIPVFSRFYIYARWCRISSINSMYCQLGDYIYIYHLTTTSTREPFETAIFHIPWIQLPSFLRIPSGATLKGYRGVGEFPST